MSTLSVKQFLEIYTIEDFKDYYYTHSQSEILTYFGISKKVYDKLRYKFNIKLKTREQREQINLRIYGVKSTLQREDVKKKAQQTLIEKYNVINISQVPVIKQQKIQTCLKTYGTEYMFQAVEYKQRLKDIFMSKYGVINPGQAEWQKEKAYKTKKARNTFNTSKPEEQLYEKLCTLFSEDDIIRWYKEERYPFKCDFYIKPLDLFIELNLFVAHGKESFDPNNSVHLEKVKQMEEQINLGKKFYASVLDVWTIRDPLKLKTAQDNNLNYITLYSKKDIDDFLLNLELEIK